MYRDLQAVSQLQLDRAICSYKLQLHRQQTNFVQNITPNSPDIIFFCMNCIYMYSLFYRYSEHILIHQ